MHVLVIPAWYDISNLISGIFFHEYCNALSKQVKVTVLNFKSHSFSDRFKKTVCEDKVSDRKYKLVNVDFYNPLPGLSAGTLKKKMKNLAVKKVKENLIEKVDIVHIQSVCNNVTPFISEAISNELKVPYVLTEHYTSFKEAGETIFAPYTSLLEVTKIVKNSAKRFGVSNYACSYFKNYFDCDFETVYNMIPDEFVKVVASKSTTGKFRFICIGNLQSRKGQAVLIEAFNKISNEILNAELVFVGDGNDKGKLEQMVNSFGLESRVKFVGNISKTEIIKQIDESDVVVSVSEKETFGLTIAEALLRGKPVISTKSGGPQELINKTNGLLTEIGDVDGLAQSLKKMHSDYSIYSASVIRTAAINKYSESTIIPLMVNQYQSVIKAASN